jgi:hypothetical protein
MMGASSVAGEIVSGVIRWRDEILSGGEVFDDGFQHEVARASSSRTVTAHPC